jgi:hypothetical protein
MLGPQRADVRQHAITTARTALGDWWRTRLGPSWGELLADPGTRADALWQAAGAVVVAVEPILGAAAADDPHTAQLLRERDFFAGQAEALRSQIERLLGDWRVAPDLSVDGDAPPPPSGPRVVAVPGGEPAEPAPPGRALVKH